MELPEGVQIVRKPNKTYFYFVPNRNTDRQGKRVPLGSDPTDPQFWAMLDSLIDNGHAQGSFDALIDEYQDSERWEGLRPATQEDYQIYLKRLRLTIGERAVSDISKPDIYACLNGQRSTPVAANHELSIIRTLLEFAVERGYRQDNPAIGVRKLKAKPQKARPWPEDGFRFVIGHAPADIQRMAFLGRATGQRASDLVRMSPRQRLQDGLLINISKLDDREHFIALTPAEIAVIDGWGAGKMDLYIKSTRNQPYTADHLNSRWNRWRASEAAKPVRDLQMTIHGLRATAVCDRRMKGTDYRIIADEICMSTDMVERYSSHIDQMKIARIGRDARTESVQSLKTATKFLEN